MDVSELGNIGTLGALKQGLYDRVGDEEKGRKVIEAFFSENARPLSALDERASFLAAFDAATLEGVSVSALQKTLDDSFVSSLIAATVLSVIPYDEDARVWLPQALIKRIDEIRGWRLYKNREFMNFSLENLDGVRIVQFNVDAAVNERIEAAKQAKDSVLGDSEILGGLITQDNLRLIEKRRNKLDFRSFMGAFNKELD